MATVTAFIRISKKNIDTAHIRFRLRDGRNVQLFHVSEIRVNPSHWDPKKQEIKAKVVYDSDERIKFNTSIAERKALLLRLYDARKKNDPLTSEWLESKVSEQLNPESTAIDLTPSITHKFDEWVIEAKFSEVRKKNLRVIGRSLKRFELYKTKILKKDWYFTNDELTPEMLKELEIFFKNEHKYYSEHTDIYAAIPEHRAPQVRGQNTINDMFTKFRTFVLFGIRQGFLTNNPFKKFNISECVFGTPYYISIEERNRLYTTNLKRHPRLAIQRDIFVFHCLIGCRVSDLIRLTKESIINDAVEYIARKTKDGRPVTVRVPLNKIAKEIVEKYKDYDETKLLPFISEQKYNDAIKRMFLAARLKRLVTVINPKTREEEKRKLNEIASSHLARRCFVGNLYKQVKDPNLVGSLSGHKEGSKAFARYRDIDEDIKKLLVDLLE